MPDCRAAQAISITGSESGDMTQINVCTDPEDFSGSSFSDLSNFIELIHIYHNWLHY